jgi:flagellar protein FliT
MSVVQALHDVTKELLKLLCEDIPDREELIEKVQTLLSKREELISRLDVNKLSLEEKKLGEEIVIQNQIIDQKMLVMKQSIQADINRIKKQKYSTDQYNNPYQNVSIDGMFFDKKK